MEYIYRDYEYKVIKLLKSLILSVCVMSIIVVVCTILVLTRKETTTEKMVLVKEVPTKLSENNTCEPTEFKVTATVYHAVEEQCNSDFLTTASGRRIKSTEEAYDHKYIAVSRDLLEYFEYGDRVMISGTGIYDGKYVVADTMNKRFKGYIDILINPDMKVGKWNNVTITKV